MKASAAAVPRNGVLLDTGVLVALNNRDDPLHRRACEWLATVRGQLHSVEPVLAEAAFFLPARTRSGLADLARQGVIRLHYPGSDGLQRMAQLFAKYADADPDWADIALVWLAESTGLRRIATIDLTDFSIYRINGRTRFEFELLGGGPGSGS